MPKTKNAFAMRRYYVMFLESNNGAMYILYGIDEEIEPFKAEIWEDTRAYANELLKFLTDNKNTRQKIQRHTTRLQWYVDTITDKIVADEKETEQYLAKLRRAKILLDQYYELEYSFWDLYQALIKIYKDIDGRLERGYQRENGKRLRKARIKKKLSQEQVASRLGMSAVGYGAYERGDRDIPTFIIYRLVKILGISADELLGL